MTERILVLAFLGLLLSWGKTLHAQTGGSSRTDSSSPAAPPGDPAEGLPEDLLQGQENDLPRDLAEQSAPSDDSPVLDFSPFDKYPRRRNFFVKIRSRMNIGLERSRGYEQGLFLGSPLKSYVRAEFSNGGGISGGVLMRKDAGEPRLADFTDGYAMISDAGPVGTFILGDYFVEAAQGIALWRGFDYGKGADVVRPVKKEGRGILPYRSSNENAFLRGAAAELRFGRVSTAVFYSQRSLSASLDSSGMVSAIYSSGTFRTAAEESKRNNLREILFGFRSCIGLGEGGNAGITFYETGFSRFLHLAGGSRFSGEGYALATVDYGLSLSRVLLFGEWTILSGSAAGVSGVLLSPSAAVDLIGALRHYPAHFLSLHGFGFGERGATSGEDGLYLGFRLKIARGVALSTYCDQFSFPDGSGGDLFPAAGHEWLTQVGLDPEQDLRFLFQYQRKTSAKRESRFSEVGLHRTLTNVQTIQRFRTHLDFRPSEAVRIRGRIEKLFLDSRTGTDREEGTMFYEDVAWAAGRKLCVSVRVVFFSTGSYETRLYEYEDDLSGATSLPALSGQGERWYLLVKCRPGRFCELSAKYSRLTRDDIRHLGSGPDELPGNHDDRIGLQLDFRL